MLSSNSSPQGSGIYSAEEVERFLEPEMVEDAREIASSRHKRTDPHKNMGLSVHTGLPKFKTDKISALGRESRHEVLTP